MNKFHKRAEKIINKLTDMVVQAEELKLDSDVTPRAVRQWKKNARSRYLSLVQGKDKLLREIKRRQKMLERECVARQVGMEERRKETVGGEDASRTTNHATKNGNGEIGEGNDSKDAKIENYTI